MKSTKLLLAIFLLYVSKSFGQANCGAASIGYTPINDLGVGISPATGLMGGLYPNGSNYLPAAHKTAGLQLASQIECLNANGSPDAVNGKMVWLSIGMSNCTQETQQFIPQANAYAGKNPKLTFVDGAQGGQTAQVISSPWNSGYTNFWNTVTTRLTNAGVTANQVQVIWFKEANVANASPNVQSYYDSLIVHIKRSMNEIKTRFPNVKTCYLASRISARYASSALNPEPYSYWTGWAVKKVIEDQINGDTQLSFMGANTKSPWLAWGIYMWSDGSTPQVSNPNIFFTCPTDFNSDGTHPSTTGAQKVGALLLNFFSTDSTTTPWFLGTGCNTPTTLDNVNTNGSFRVYPNPFSTSTTLQFMIPVKDITITIHNCLGETIREIKNNSEQTIELYRDNFPAGLYYINVMQEGATTITNKLIIAE